MKDKKVWQIMLGVIACVLVFSAIFTMQVANAFQANNFIGKGYFQVYKGGSRIGNIKDIDDVKKQLVVQYGDKMNQDVYFGDDVNLEYVPYNEEIVKFSDVPTLIKQLDVKIDGIQVRTMEGKEFFVTSYHDWQDALKDTIQFIAKNDADKFNYDSSVKGEIKVAEQFFYENKKIPIETIMDKDEVKERIIYENVTNVQTDVVQEGDTVESIATRNNLSAVQLEFANNVAGDSILIPGAEMNVSEVDYALKFSYPILENKIEEIAFEIEYQDNPDAFKDEEEVLQEGVNGSARAQYYAYIVNGESEPGERLEYQIIQEPVKKIIKRGTKERPAASTTGGDAGWSVGTDAPYANLAGFIWPSIGICVSAEYGWYEYGRHNGIDIAGNTGDQIWAAAAGTVEMAGYNGSFGNHVSINHHNGLVTTYSHMSSIGVNKGQEVSQGTYVGGMGRTGFADGTHLHFEVHADGARLNPRGYLPAGGPSSC